eukprot:312849-Pyramimonas_sp.AAC.1
MRHGGVGAEAAAAQILQPRASAVPSSITEKGRGGRAAPRPCPRSPRALRTRGPASPSPA